MVRANDLVVSLRDVGVDDLHFLGNHSDVSSEGFAITSYSYFKFLRDGRLESRIRHLLESINFDRDDSLHQVAKNIKNLIISSKIPDKIVYRVVGHYGDLGSSKVLASMSIITGDPRQHKVVEKKSHTIEGDSVLLDTVRALWSSLYDPALIAYRNKNRLDHLKTGAAVIVQEI